MTNDVDRAAIEEELRNLYNSGHREQVPHRLDTMVMRAAKREVRNNNRSWILPWRRRIAFAAMVSLSLAIVLEVSEVSVFEPNPFAMPDVEREFEAEAEQGSLQMREIGKTTAAHLSLGEDSASRRSVGADPACNMEQMATPTSWLECIAQLRAGGFGADADAELQKLQLTFPDFSLAQ